jgi:hypothetical protein
MGSISINSLAARILGNYDYNLDGVLNLAKPLREVERQEKVYYFDRTVISTYTQQKLIEQADKNKDNQVTEDELKAVIATFDENGDGKLETRGSARNPKKEYEKFDVALGEIRTNVVTIPVSPPFPPLPPNPLPPIPIPLPPRRQS